ncbi:MAG: dTDP-4-dehydrorhamnose reductase [Candidatus Acidiferrales bacterium]
MLEIDVTRERRNLKVAVTGSAGLLGQGLVEVFRSRHNVAPLTHAEVDITNADQVHIALAEFRPDVVVHAAAIPDLDACEADPPKAVRVNVDGTQHVVDAAGAIGAAVAYISTDAVFDGKKQTPYIESDLTNPPTVYGRTKLLGEEIVRSFPSHWIFRVSVLFGPGKTNFIEKGLRKLATGQELVAAMDQLGSATYTLDAARKIMELVEAKRYGLFHLSNVGACTRLELAQRAAFLAGLDPKRVIGRPMDQMGRLAKRLKYAVMEMNALEQAGFSLPRRWEDALAEYVRAGSWGSGRAGAGSF